jgi:hypothetical protein
MHMQVWLRYVIAVVIVAGTAAPGRCATRIALLATTSDVPTGNIRSLAELQLSQIRDVQVLERQQIDRLLSEQQLSLSGLVDADQAVRAGKVFSADLLAILESSAKSHDFGLVIFDAATGARLFDAAIDAVDGAKSADAVLQAVRSAMDKRQHVDKLKTICLMTVRNGDMPRDMDGFCDAVGRLVERQLSGSAGLAVLERSRLEQVTRERALGAATHDLAASLVVAELEIDRNGAPDALTATAILSDTTGKQENALKISIPGSDAAALAVAITDELTRKLNIPLAAAVNRKLEAARFERESNLRDQNGDFIRALTPAEAAHALSPDDTVLYAGLARALVFHGRALYAGPGPEAHRVKESWKDPMTAPASLVRGAQMLADLAPRILAAEPNTRTAGIDQCDRAADELCDFIMFATLNQKSYADMSPEPFKDLAMAKAALRRYLLARDADLFAQVRDAKSFDDYSKHLVGLLSDDEWICSSSSDEWTADLLELSERWLKLRRDKYPNRNSAAATEALETMSIDWQFEHHRKISIFRPGVNHRSRRWDPTAAGFGRLETLSNELRTGNDTILHQYGHLCHLATAVTRESDSTDRMAAEVEQFLKAKEAEISNPALKDRPDVRLLLYRLMQCADHTLDQTNWAGHYSVELMNFCLSRNEIEPEVLYRGMCAGSFGPPKAADVERRTAALEKFLTVLKAPDSVVLQSSREHLESYYGELLAELRQTYQHAPGVATVKPWQNSRELIDLFDAREGLQWVFNPIVDGRSIYAVGAAHDGPTLAPTQLRLLRFSLDGKAIDKMPPIAINDLITQQNPRIRSGHNPMFIMGACLADGCYCAATWRHGLLIFPTDGNAVEVIDEHSGLPTNSARAIASLDGKIYAGLGLEGSEGYIVACDRRTHAVDVLASGARKQKQSPFDDDETFEVPSLIADPPRKRLIVAVQRYEPQTQLNGLWEYKPATRQWRQLLPMRLLRPSRKPGSHLVTGIKRILPLSGDRILIVSNVGWYIFDLAHDRAEIIAQESEPGGPEMPLPSDTPKFSGASSEALAAVKGRRISAWGDSALIGDWFWDAGTYPRTWGRCNLKTGRGEDFPSPRENAYPFVPFYIRPIGDGSQMLVGDHLGLWILDMTQSPH